MIFVTVGTQLPFDRLVRGVDIWAAAHPQREVFAQTGQLGAQNYTPRHMTHAPTLDPARFDAMCRKADLIIAHAGIGSLITAHTNATPLLIMPRQAGLGEHRNDHQLATADSLGQKSGVHVVMEEDALGPAIDALLTGDATPPHLAEFADDSLITALRDVIFPHGE